MNTKPLIYVFFVSISISQNLFQGAIHFSTMDKKKLWQCTIITPTPTKAQARVVRKGHRNQLLQKKETKKNKKTKKTATRQEAVAPTATHLNDPMMSTPIKPNLTLLFSSLS